ncbi:pirin family protein [Streptomyces sp. H10-C2]|uniref:pirin family protein n=1 Tax=unclassified Streptomyces TaxID=2593676 RepID=UPI0024BA0C6B|nr:MULTISPECIES: pirin family protein [unclassified Streptomyces]MDJ0343704.1 pirin family protein [Streptomyces sp. PH10-H1]MDJ0372369.1 pirin family protein [Streptomyces sp. H10-C2]
MIEVWRGGQRYAGGDPAGGIETLHAFSFGSHYDPDNLRFGPLLACNEERLAPGAGFAEHPHRAVEIVTWVIEGELGHRDSAGHGTVVRAGEVQLLSAGDGVRHVERNAGDVPLRFLQMWLEPAVSGGEPRYAIETTERGTRFVPERQPHATLVVGRGTMALPDAPFLYIHVVRGSVRLGTESLGEGDAARVTGAEGLRAEADGPVEYLVWEMRPSPRAEQG